MKARGQLYRLIITQLLREHGRDLIPLVNTLIERSTAMLVILCFVLGGLSPLSGTMTSHASVKVTHNDVHEHADDHHDASTKDISPTSSNHKHQHAHDVCVSCAHCAQVAPTLNLPLPNEVVLVPQGATDDRTPNSRHPGSIFRPPISA